MATVPACFTWNNGKNRYDILVSPKSISWSYSADKYMQDTKGGRVIQILSTTIDDITFSGVVLPPEGGDYASRYENMRKMENAMREIFEWNTSIASVSGNERVQGNPVKFSFGIEGLEGKVYLSSFGGIKYSTQDHIFTYTIKLIVDTGFSSLEEISSGNEVNMLSQLDDINWQRDAFHMVTNADTSAVEARLEALFNSAGYGYGGTDSTDSDSSSSSSGSGSGTIPSGLGAEHTYMGWQMITADSSQLTLKNYLKDRNGGTLPFNDDGFAYVDGRYVIACTTTFGKIGDKINFSQSDGLVIKCIMGDEKNQSDAGCTKWGHDNGKCVIEFIVDKRSWYSTAKGGEASKMHANPGSSSCHPEWNKDLKSWANVGSYNYK